MSIATVSGMDRVTGAALSGRAHMRQSIMDILTTPIGSRVGQREYGSRLPELIDAPLNEQGRQAIYAATAGAIARWYPAFVLTNIALSDNAASALVISLSGHERGTSPDLPISLEVSLPASATIAS